MKTITRLLPLMIIIIIMTGFSSCTKSSDEMNLGKAEFSLSLPSSSLTKSVTVVDSGIVSYQLMISVDDLNGKNVFSDKLIPLYTFGTGFVSDKIEIKAGEFRLTKFMVINPSGAVIYASPLKESPLAYLTTKPLPFTFNIFPGKVTTVLPEVLSVGNQPPDQFGYANFGTQIIKPLEFYAFCIIDNPLIMAPTVMTSAKVTVYGNNGWYYTFQLAASVNHLVIRAGSDVYTFVIEKEGYEKQTVKFTAQTLLASTKENPLILKIPYNSVPSTILYLQPGPDGGKDAMVSNLEPDKNFGAHIYFEATYMSESILTVMRSNMSLIWFDLSQLPKGAVIKKAVMKLSYEAPIPWDSTIFTSGNSTTPVKPCGVLQQIIEPWEENTVTWNKLPKTTEINQVFIAPFIRNVNFIEIDVTGLFVLPASNILPNYGMLFKLNSYDKFKGFRFASSDHSEAALRPKLTIQYTVGK
jgi:hypothetical protein